MHLRTVLRGNSGPVVEVSLARDEVYDLFHNTIKDKLVSVHGSATEGLVIAKAEVKGKHSIKVFDREPTNRYPYTGRFFLRTYLIGVKEQTGFQWAVTPIKKGGQLITPALPPQMRDEKILKGTGTSLATVEEIVQTAQEAKSEPVPFPHISEIPFHEDRNELGNSPKTAFGLLLATMHTVNGLLEQCKDIAEVRLEEGKITVLRVYRPRAPK